MTDRRAQCRRGVAATWLTLVAALAACGGGSPVSSSDEQQAVRRTPATTGERLLQQPAGSPAESPETTVRNPPETDSPVDPIRDRIRSMSLRDKVRQLIVVGFSGTSAPTAAIRNLHPGGLIYFSSNLQSRDQIRNLSQGAQRLSRRVGQPLLTMTDQESGVVTRIPGTQDAPGGAEFAGDAREARRTAHSTGDLLHQLGINVNLAPIADVNTAGSGGVIGHRSFSADPGVAARLVRAQVCGYHAGGVAPTAKHFPGHGSTTTDSHASTATISRSASTWRRLDRPPFDAAVSNDVDVVMLGHLAFPAMDPTGRPATISGPLTRGLLRQRLGFDGVVISDALNMGGITSWGSPRQIAVEAIGAGVDLLLMPPQPVAAVRGVLQAVHDGRLTEARVNVSVERILRLKQRLGLYAAASSLSTC